MPSRTNSCCIQPNLNNICNTIDCSLLNNPSSDSTKPNDQCELFLYEEQEENKPSITSLATTTSLELQEQEETLESKANNLYYCFANTEEFNSFNPNPHSKLFIQREQGDLKETLMTLSNYRFYLEEINQDSNNANNHLKNHSNNSFNDINQDFNNPNHTNNHTNINHFNANMNTDSNNLSINNHLNPNQDSLAIQANLESKDSTPSTYTLQTILQKDKAYSTLGIEL
ncbi:hypothetical protein, partial [Helicobacter sp. MIT 05-5294]|uniref:hypothetical protein n=1 Tax=Helicobacter sp. MIT 05-5294 TaxID=1548150 RepID=UPI001107A6BB